MGAQELNRDLIGEPGSQAMLQTPALVIDLDRLEANIARMAEHARRNGIALRPHAKTHKCAAIAKLQIAAGALGICVAKLGEAEALADAGIDSILITSPVVSERGIARLVTCSGVRACALRSCALPGAGRPLSTTSSRPKFQGRSLSSRHSN